MNVAPAADDGRVGPPHAVPVAGLPPVGRCRVMGVINVTPDSFSDGGAFDDADSAVKHGLGLLTAGADLLDVGGESTRPGAQRVPPDEEWRRIGPVVTDLAAAGALVSVDTMRAATAERALAAGAVMVNDVSGGRADPALLKMVADARVPYVVMHWRGHSTSMQSRAVYADVVGEVVAELAASVEAAVAAGIDPGQLVVDPGLGFAKDAEHNWQLLAHLDRLQVLGFPVLVGASRKSFLGRLLGTPDEPRNVVERDDATTALTALAAVAGAWGVRVHDVRGSADAVRVAAAVVAARSAR